MITLRPEPALLYNINHPHYTGRSIGTVAVEKKWEWFAESGLINSLSVDMALK